MSTIQNELNQIFLEIQLYFQNDFNKLYRETNFSMLQTTLPFMKLIIKANKLFLQTTDDVTNYYKILHRYDQEILIRTTFTQHHNFIKSFVTRIRKMMNYWVVCEADNLDRLWFPKKVDIQRLIEAAQTIMGTQIRNESEKEIPIVTEPETLIETTTEPETLAEPITPIQNKNITSQEIVEMKREYDQRFQEMTKIMADISEDMKRGFAVLASSPKKRRI